VDANQLFMLEHARAHSVEMQRGDGGALDALLRGPAEDRHLADRLEDAALFGLNDEQLRISPKAGQNSIVWLLWHMARTEDVMMNVLVAGQPQLISEEGWTTRLNVSLSDIGAGMKDDAVADFTAKVDIAALRDYRAAVGRRTREIVSSLTAEEIEAPIEQAHLERALAEGVLGENTGWIPDFWRDRRKAWCLSLVNGHNYLHIGEAFCVRSQAGLALGA